MSKGEKETGVSIHFVTEEIDAGPIIVQEKYPVSPKDNFNTLGGKSEKGIVIKQFVWTLPLNVIYY